MSLEEGRAFRDRSRGAGESGTIVADLPDSTAKLIRGCMLQGFRGGGLRKLRKAGKGYWGNDVFRGMRIKCFSAH